MLISRLKLTNVLSFRESAVDLGQLNILIGPNAVGKSNLIEVIGLLQATPSGFAAAILKGGGVRQWIWLGGPHTAPIAEIECEFSSRSIPVRYGIEFSEDSNGLTILGERVEQIAAVSGLERSYLSRTHNMASYGAAAHELLGFSNNNQMHLSGGESIFAQFRNPSDPTPVTELGKQLARIRTFREFRTGPQSGARVGVSTSAPKEGLADEGDNLALVLHDLDFMGRHDRVMHYVRRFCERFEEIKIKVGSGIAQVYLKEAGLQEMLSAIRMSDGTLKFLALLAVLFHPAPPPLVCIEEPETGLHPDALLLIAEALKEAAETTQLVVTTHSEALVDAFSDNPEAVLVCERDFDNGTQMKKLSKDDLKEWLQHYTLGQLWRNGEIGGGRW